MLIRMSRGSGLSGLGAMAREAPLPVGGEASAGAAAARDSESAPHRHARARPDRIRRRSLEPRSALHPRAPARGDARRSPARGSMRAGCRCWRGGCGARRPRSRPRSMARWPRCHRHRGRTAGRSCSMPANSTACPRRWPCGCSAARSLAPATRDRSSSASSRRLYEALKSANADDASHWRRTLAGALVTLGGTRLAIERAPARRAGAARAVWKLKKLAKSATQGRQDGKRN